MIYIVTIGMCGCVFWRINLTFNLHVPFKKPPQKSRSPLFTANIHIQLRWNTHLKEKWLVNVFHVEFKWNRALCECMLVVCVVVSVSLDIMVHLVYNYLLWSISVSLSFFIPVNLTTHSLKEVFIRSCFVPCCGNRQIYCCSRAKTTAVQ